MRKPSTVHRTGGTSRQRGHSARHEPGTQHESSWGDSRELEGHRRVSQEPGAAQAIDRGEYRYRAELAHQLGFTRAPVTQILDLLLLAPDIQEHVVHLEAVDGVEPIAERALRDVVRHESWAEQRRAWASISAQ